MVRTGVVHDPERNACVEVLGLDRSQGFRYAFAIDLVSATATNASMSAKFILLLDRETISSEILHSLVITRKLPRELGSMRTCAASQLELRWLHRPGYFAELVGFSWK